MLEGKTLITGASGFVGGRVREQLAEAGADFVAIRRKGSPEPELGRSVVADYADLESLKAVLQRERPDYLLHVAGVTKGRSYADFERGNVIPTRNLLQACVDVNLDLKRFVMVSSLTSYGPSSPTKPITESDPQQPVEYYGMSKRDAEAVVREFAERVPTTVILPAAVYGPRDVDVFNLFKSAIKGWNVFFGNRDKEMSIVYVDDCVRAIFEAAKHPNTLGKSYFIAHPKTETWSSLQQAIVDAMPRRVRTLDLPEFFVTLASWGGELATMIDGKPRLLNRQKAIMGAQQAWTCSVEAAQRELGFEATIPLSEGVPQTHAWYQREGWYAS